jgi:hypothetical protein
MEFNPQRTNEARTLGDFRALCAAAHVAPEALEGLLAAGLLEAAHKLPTGDLFDLRPNRLQTIREQLAETKTKTISQ